MSEETVTVIPEKKQPKLTEKTIFFVLEFNRFGNTRKADVEVKTVASQDRFAHTKRLLNSPELAAIVKEDAALRAWMDKPNRCWKYGKSIRLLSLDQADEVFTRCHKYEHEERPKLIEAFLGAYLAEVAEAQKDLGPEFNPKNYPTLEEVKGEFSMDWSFPTFETSEKLKVVSPKLYAMEVEKAEGKLANFAEEIQEARRVLFKELVDKLLDAISPSTDGKKKKLHASAVEKLQEFLATDPLRNVTNDQDLQGEVAKLKLIMSGVDADKIRESDNLKANLTSAFTEVSKDLASLAEVKGRKFR